VIKLWQFIALGMLLGVHSVAEAQATRRGGTVPTVTPEQAAARQAEQEAAQKRQAAAMAEQAAAEQKFAALRATKDGKLKVSSLSLKHKKLFMEVYDEQYFRLDTAVPPDLRPYIMYSGLIQGYSDLCPQSLSKDKATVEIEASQYMGSDYAPFTRTDYYKKYIAVRLAMEPRFVEAYRDSQRKFLSEYLKTWRLTSPDGELLSGYLILSGIGIELAKDSRAMITENGCGNPAIIKFMDNLTTYTSGAWVTDQTDRLVWGEENPLNIQPLARYNKEYDMPKSVNAAIESRQFKILRCAYFINQNVQATEYYWKAGEPTPPADVVAYYDMVRPAVAECPAKVPPELKR
jgi:hypothetical protein